MATPTRKPAAKKPTAAELARREAQSDADTGKTRTVTVDGFTITIDLEDADDYDRISALKQGDPDPFLQAFFPQEADRHEVLEALRDDKGKLRQSRVVKFVTDAFEEAGQGNS